MKVSVIVPVYNCLPYISICLDSIISQDYQDIEIIVVDGGSGDGTINVVKSYGPRINNFISQTDLGVYDALNKGINLASGDIVGGLNADDHFSSNQVISLVVECFKKSDCEAVYGNLNYFRNAGGLNITREWKSGPYSLRSIRFGWMPAHPTVYIKREIHLSFGPYLLNFGSSGDYEFMLRYFLKKKIKAYFLDELLVNMREGGMSNGSFGKRYTALVNDYKILVYSKVAFPIVVLILKRLRKVDQYF
jgi:glycosyltransferase involved in cell wall biosynthesis